MEKRCKVLGSDVHYWEFNPEQPTTVVMVHGFRGTHHGLQDIVDNLPDMHVIVPDLPGFDASKPMTARQHDIDGYRDFVIGFIHELSLKQPVLLGHSFGSIVAAAAVAEDPTIAKKLILVNTIAEPLRDAPLAWAVNLFYWLGRRLPERASRLLMGNPLVVRMMSELLAKTPNKDLRRDIHRRHLKHFSTYHSSRTLYEAYVSSITRSVLQMAEHIHLPTLLIAGELDTIAPLRGQQRLDKTIPNAELVMLPGVGHLVHYEKPAEVAKAIRHFLAK